jgi:hypothetical protein
VKDITMPGKQVKNWKRYHALRRKGYSKSSAARIANSRRRNPRRKKRR